MKKKLNIYILETDVSKISTATRKLLLSTIRKHALKAADALSLKSVFNITLYPNPDWVIPHTGDGGYAPSKDWVQLSIDLTRKPSETAAIIKKRIPATIYHEMNHLKRWGSVGYGKTLLESIISEGIACVFEYEMWKTDQEPLFFESEEEITRMLGLVKRHIAKKDIAYVHSDWFFGTNPSIPKWLGYKVGYYLVRKALENDSKETILDLTTLSSDEIISLSGISGLK